MITVGAEVVVIAVLAAGIATLVGSVLDESVRRWWWLVLLAGVGAGIAAGVVEQLVRGGATTPPVLVENDASAVPPAMVLDDATVPSSAALRELATRSSVPAAPPVMQQAGAGFEVLWVPKRSHSEVEFEDAWAADAAQGRFALSDGASSAYMSQAWAKLIVEGFVASPESFGATSLSEWLQAATGRWSSSVAVADASSSDQWWAAESAARGSDATLIGLELSGRVPGEWQARAVGDSCLVHLTGRGGSLVCVRSFPLDEPGAFGRHPDLVSTLNTESQVLPTVELVAGECAAGDRFLLMTDALAEWALSTELDDPDVWNRLASVDREEFGDLVTTARAQGTLQDDDTTLMRVAV